MEGVVDHSCNLDTPLMSDLRDNLRFGLHTPGSSVPRPTNHMVMTLIYSSVWFLNPPSTLAPPRSPFLNPLPGLYVHHS